MNFLVTGCFGFIGFNFINKLLDERNTEIKIFGIDSLQNDCSIKNHELSKEYDNFNFFKDDINNINTLDIKNIDTIINFAAESHVDNSIYNPGLFIDSNVKGVSELLKYAIKNNVNNFLHVSTDEVYGSIEDGYFNEGDKLNPSSPYSASKASAELIINSFNRTYGYDVVMVRPANNYGIFQQPEKLIPFSIAKLESGENVEIYGDGKNIRHWLHVDDTSEAILKILDSEIKTGIYNIGSDFYLSNIDLIKKLIEILNFDEEKISYVKDRPGHDFRYATDIQKLMDIGWKPKANFEEELEKTTNWYLNNKNWWESGYKSILDFKREKRLGIV
tara:strand:+ start:868 stop:1863 length:996 start_codon:yes stop_codon:yes gene_type:complete